MWRTLPVGTGSTRCTCRSEATLRARCAGSGGADDAADPSALVAQRYLDACPRLSKANIHAVDATDAKDVRAALDAAFRGLAKPV